VDEAGRVRTGEHGVMVNQRTRAGLLVTGLLMTLVTVTGCGGKDKPAVCSDVDSLQSSISGLKDVKLQQGALTTLQNKLTQVQDDYNQLKSDAKSQFSSELSAVDSAATAFKTSLQAASADPSAATLAALAVPLQTLTSALSNLQSAVQDTC
jgi:hypothetical protein